MLNPEIVLIVGTLESWSGLDLVASSWIAWDEDSSGFSGTALTARLLDKIWGHV